MFGQERDFKKALPEMGKQELNFKLGQGGDFRKTSISSLVQQGKTVEEIKAYITYTSQFVCLLSQNLLPSESDPFKDNHLALRIPLTCSITTQPDEKI